MKKWKGEGTFAENAKREPEIAARLSASEIDRLCSLDIHFKHVDATFKALGFDCPTACKVKVDTFVIAGSLCCLLCQCARNDQKEAERYIAESERQWRNREGGAWPFVETDTWIRPD